MDREEMLEKLTRLDFMSVDLQLYLNTHPTDCNAIEQYNQVVWLANKYRSEYENLYGPLTSFRSLSRETNWEWIDNPWPWNEEFNFKTCNRGM